jgi:lipoprotein-anchoring transpeptidase ErfK/SrfK
MFFAKSFAKSGASPPRHRTGRSTIDRRTLLFTLAGVLAASSQPLHAQTLHAQTMGRALSPPRWLTSTYAAIPDEPFPIAAVDVHKIDRRYLRQLVAYRTGEPPGTIIVDPNRRFLYLVMEDGQALRYGVGVGRQGFGWSGRAIIQRKARWPKWTPTANMIRRDPRLQEYANGMEPGLDNPLGARALYLYQDGRDTLYRLHGTNEPWSIGQAASSGCIRLFNQDAIDLHRRTPVGSQVVVLEHG